ncbi:hypothetical protein JCM17845_14740 [Iodidimonas gelatinilytica]|uniref:Alkylhydroperoxidase n=1 Tax=Iodidimonas gelatinilytica TaxID=1236966 RepID=A0A5A7MXP7_9PROT|nr:peroxidase-related enzyme [Iodidimonas gelatinilytica]GER00851.1 hypothetical protein JCM17845_14740 [Iodidimonas gelatinilytica]
MTWITTIKPDEASGELKSLYEDAEAEDGIVDGLLMAHALRPHTLAGHMALYRSIFHHPGNKLPSWILDVVGVYTSLVNGCPYCVEYCYAALREQLDDDDRAAQIRTALEAGLPQTALAEKYVAAAYYAEKLARSPRAVRKTDIDALRHAGFDDGEILEINQVVSYFSYVNRTILGLGVSEDSLISRGPYAEKKS